ncbi:hypothetical protein [Clostridium drakei]|uniref:Uncharacterized protein n=1 Tax=Clostridium drakei TaxID=332101 RepID=A0A2U8DMV6_9CLOT|nr:hypothetical protein [Clostridium drakei]AWI04076.1 hypothetical protein B9W14_06070 [Clostridium drakei]
MKSKKIVASLMALSIIGSSSVVLGGNVQAASSNKTMQKNNSIMAMVNNYDSFSVYCTLDTETMNDLNRYFNNTPSPTAIGVRDILIRNNYYRDTANEIGYSIYSIMAASKTQDGKMDPFKIEMRLPLAVLQSKDHPGTFTLAIYEKNRAYDAYVTLTPSDIKLIKGELARLGRNDYAVREQLKNFLLDKGIAPNKQKAYNVATVLTNKTDWMSVTSDSEDLVVLATKVAEEPSFVYMLARSPR